MSGLESLYQELILDHSKRRVGFGLADEEGRSATSHQHNPLCGDKLVISAAISGDRIEDIKFEGSGCAISKASASLMTEAVKGHSVAEARRQVGR